MTVTTVWGLAYDAVRRAGGAERLLTGDFLRRIARADIGAIAIDEAHCISHWGHDFRPEYLMLSNIKKMFPEIPMIALTATADPQTRAEIIQRLSLVQAKVFVSSFDRPNIRYAIEEKDNPRAQLKNFLKGHEGESGIVYCLSRKKTESTAEWLRSQGFEALPYHAGMDAAERQRNHELPVDAHDLIDTEAGQRVTDKQHEQVHNSAF